MTIVWVGPSGTADPSYGRDGWTLTIDGTTYIGGGGREAAGLIGSPSSMTHPLAGQKVPRSLLVDVPRLVSAYFQWQPDPADPAQQVAFGTSGHRGSSLSRAFNEPHILAITQATCEVRARAGVDGPLFLGKDTHGLSEPAHATVLEVLAAHGVEVRMAIGGQPTPTPAVSFAILEHNRGRDRGLADGLVLTRTTTRRKTAASSTTRPHGGPAEAT